MVVENNGAAQVQLVDASTGADWRFQNFQNNFRVTLAGTGNAELDLDGSGNLTIRGGLVTGTAGSCTGATPCDGVFAPVS